MPHLVTALRDKSCGPTVATVLGELGDARAVAPLIQALDDKDTSRPATTALGRMGDSAALPALQCAIGQHAEEAYDIALARLGDAAALERFLNALRIDVVDKTPKAHETRRRAADALGEIGNRQAIGALVDSLHDKKGDVRLAAVGALGKIAAAEAVEPLLTALRNEADATTAELEATERLTAEAGTEIRQRRYAVRQTAATALLRSARDQAAERLALC